MQPSELTLRGGSVAPPRVGDRSLRGQLVLDEDTYTSGLSRIIQRDFFPHLPRLAAENAYLGALEAGDEAEIRRTARHLVREEQRCGVLEENTRRGDNGELLTPLDVPATPATPATPVGGETPAWASAQRAPPTMRGWDAETPVAGAADATPRPASPDPSPPDTLSHVPANMSLESYQARYTTEDNAAFAQLMDLARVRRRIQHQWAYDAEDRAEAEAETGGGGQQGLQALPAPGAPAESKDSPTAGALITRDASSRAPAKPPASRYKARNNLMFAPDADVDTLRRRTSSRTSGIPPTSAQAPRVSHASTRMPVQAPESAMPDTPSSSVIDAAIRGEASPAGSSPASPRVAGYGFVTPLAETPAATPAATLEERRMQQLLAQSRTPIRASAAPEHVDAGGFKIPPAPRRDELAQRASTKRATPRSTPKQATPASRARTARRTASELSPAGQRLLQRTRGGTSSLQAHRAAHDAEEERRRRRLAERSWSTTPSPVPRRG